MAGDTKAYITNWKLTGFHGRNYGRGEVVNMTDQEALKYLSNGTVKPLIETPMPRNLPTPSTFGLPIGLPENLPYRDVLIAAGYDKLADLAALGSDNFTQISGIGGVRAREIAAFLGW
jgi:hypothetical protein